MGRQKEGLPREPKYEGDSHHMEEPKMDPKRPDNPTEAVTGGTPTRVVTQGRRIGPEQGLRRGVAEAAGQSGGGGEEWMPQCCKIILDVLSAGGS